jgi:hypothetical protein
MVIFAPWRKRQTLETKKPAQAGFFMVQKKQEWGLSEGIGVDFGASDNRDVV